MQAWDYEVWTFKADETQKLATTLQTKGQQGWELISLTPVAKSIMLEGTTTEMVAVFKRPGRTIEEPMRRIG